MTIRLSGFAVRILSHSYLSLYSYKGLLCKSWGTSLTYRIREYATFYVCLPKKNLYLWHNSCETFFIITYHWETSWGGQTYSPQVPLIVGSHQKVSWNPGKGLGMGIFWENHHLIKYHPIQKVFFLHHCFMYIFPKTPSSVKKENNSQ